METDATLLRNTRPRYAEASLSDVLPSTLSALVDDAAGDVLGLRSELAGVQRAVVLLVDGLGYHLLAEATRSSPALADAWATRRGSLRQLTTGFPSTTPTSLASLGSGLPPGRHGVLGFTVRIPDTEKLLCHIEWDDVPDPAQWQPELTCFERARELGVAVSAVSRQKFQHSGLTVAAFRGADYLPADDVASLVAGIDVALARPAPGLVYGYFPLVDRAGHVYGPGSPQWHEAVGQLDVLLRQILALLPADAALLVTSDHGMIGVRDVDRFDVSAHPSMRRGVQLVAGEPRARYVYTEPGAAAEVAEIWQSILGPRADVVTREHAVAAGWFGELLPAAHADRVGDVVAVARDRHVLLGVPECDSPTVAGLRGFHGGLTEAELSIPLWLVRGRGLSRTAQCAKRARSATRIASPRRPGALGQPRHTAGVAFRSWVRRRAEALGRRRRFATRRPWPPSQTLSAPISTTRAAPSSMSTWTRSSPRWKSPVGRSGETSR